MTRRSASDREWSLEVARRWQRRRYRVQQREKVMADLREVLDASFVGAFVRWIARRLDR